MTALLALTCVVLLIGYTVLWQAYKCLRRRADQQEQALERLDDCVGHVNERSLETQRRVALCELRTEPLRPKNTEPLRTKVAEPLRTKAAAKPAEQRRNHAATA